MQSAQFLFGDFKSFELGALSSFRWMYDGFGTGHYDALEGLLRCEFDLVYRVSSFAPGLEHVEEQLNVGGVIGSASAYYRSPAWGGTDSRFNHRPDLRAREHEKICPNMTRCKERVYAIAPFDVRLYELAQRLESRAFNSL